MEQLLTKLMDEIKKDKTKFIAFKNLVVKCQQFELACKVREMEMELFPDTEEQKNAKATAKELNTLFRMVELDIPEDICWVISETLKLHSTLGGDFGIRDASVIVVKRKDLFGDKS